MEMPCKNNGQPYTVGCECSSCSSLRKTARARFKRNKGRGSEEELRKDIDKMLGRE
jgi:hypothetical protein